MLAAIFVHSLPLACLMRPPPKRQPVMIEIEASKSVNHPDSMGSTLCTSLKEGDETCTSPLKEGDETCTYPLKEGDETCLMKTKKYFKATFDCSLLRNIYALLFVLCSVLMSLSSGVPYTFLPLKCEENGLSKYQSASILSTMGIAEIGGKLIIGFIGYKIDFTILYILSALLRGVAFILLSCFDEYHLIMIAAILDHIGFGKYKYDDMIRCYIFHGVPYTEGYSLLNSERERSQEICVRLGKPFQCAFWKKELFSCIFSVM